MAYLRLFDPVNQFALKNGALNVSGRLFVYYEVTDDLADIYDENGTQLQQPAILDNNGRARGLFVDAAKTYWMDVQDRYGESLFTIRKMTPCGGGGGSSLSDFGGIVSADGSIAVNSYYEAGKLVYDLSVADDTTDMLEWLHAEGYTVDSGRMIPTYAEGSINIGEDGAMLHGNMYYHVTARVRASSTVQPLYNEFSLMFKGQGADTVYTYRTDKLVLDCSTELSHDFEVSFDMMPSEDIGLYAELDGVASGVSVGLSDMQVHRVYSGVLSVPDRVAQRPWVSENYQEKLTPGTGITIDENNVISADPQQQADWNQSDSTAVDFIKNKPTIPSGSQLVPSAAPSDAGEVLTVDQNGDPTWSPAQAPISAGDGIDITNNVVSAKVDGTTVTVNASGELVATASAPQVQSDWAQSDSTAVDFIKNKPDLSQYATTTDLAGKADKVTGATAGDVAVLDANGNLTDTGVSATNLVHDSSYVHTDENFTSAEKTKLSGIASGAEVNVQSDWNQTDSSADDYIKNKPTIPPGVTVDQTYNSSSTNAQSGTAVAGALATINEVPASSSTDEGKVLTVDAHGNPGWATAQAPISAGNGISISSNTVSAKVDGTTVSFNANGELTATASGGGVNDVEVNGTSVVNAQGVAEVTVPTVPTLKELVAGSNITITEGANNVTIAATASAQVQSNWNESDASSPAYIQNKPSIPDATSDLTNDSGFITLSDVPAQVQANWNESDSSAASYIQNKPTIPAAQVNADWTASSGVAEILNKPSIPSATSDLTNDSGFITLSDVPAQVQSDWNETDTSDPAYIANKPSIPAAQVNADWTASSGVAEILHKPTIPTATSDLTNDSGFITLSDVPVIGTITI